MPNFDLFERMLILCLVGNTPIEQTAARIYALPNPQKVKIVKNKTKKEIADFLQKCISTLHNHFPENRSFSSSPNNRIGKDIFERTTSTHVEIKSGMSMTDANCGLTVVSWALNDDADFIKQNMTSGMNERRTIFASGGTANDIENSKIRQMDYLYAFLHNHLQCTDTSRLCHFFKNISRGVTNGDAIIESYNKNGTRQPALMLMCDWEHGLIQYDKAFGENEIISIFAVDRTDK